MSPDLAKFVWEFPTPAAAGVGAPLLLHDEAVAPVDKPESEQNLAVTAAKLVIREEPLHADDPDRIAAEHYFHSTISRSKFRVTRVLRLHNGVRDLVYETMKHSMDERVSVRRQMSALQRRQLCLLAFGLTPQTNQNQQFDNKCIVLLFPGGRRWQHWCQRAFVVARFFCRKR